MTTLLDLSDDQQKLIYKAKRELYQSDKKKSKLELVNKDARSWQPDKILSELKTILHKSEIDFFSYLLNSDNIKKTIDELGLTTESFHTNMAMKIFDHLEYLQFESRDEFFQQLLNSEDAEAELNEVITNILFINDEFSQSSHWNDYRVQETSDEIRVLKENIRKLMIINMEEERNDLIRRIEKNPENDELLISLKELDKKRQEMYEQN